MAALKLYLEPSQLKRTGQHVAAMAKRLGIELSNCAESSVCMPLTDLTAQDFSQKFPNQFMPFGSLRRLTDRIDAQNLSIPVVFASLDPEAVKGPVFVKQRRTYKHYKNPLAYTAWQSSAAFLAAHGEAFTEFQKNPDPFCGELVFQPQWQYPARDFEVNFSVNQDGEVYFFLCNVRESAGIAQISRNFTDAVPEQIKNDIQKICLEEKVRGGFHCVEWSFQNNKWQMFDWNPRPALYLTTHHFADVGLADAALAHMCGLEVAPATPPVVFEQRGYYGNPISPKWYSFILGMGLKPRIESRGITRVTGTAADLNSLSNLFVQMEKTCAN